MRSFCPSASLAKSLMMLFLAVMLICVHTAALAAETQPEMAMPVVEETVIPSHAKADNDALIEEYVSSLFYPRFVSKDLNLGGRLEGNEAVLYRLMKASAEKIAAGESASTQLSYPIADVLETATFTPEDLGVAELLDASGQPTSEVVSKLQAYIAVDQQTLLDALVYDLPYDLYWFDKEEGMAGSTSYGFSWYSDGSAITINGSFNFSLAVAGAYQDGELYRFNTALASNAKTAASNAKALVTANAGNNDLTKLKNYKNAICNYVSYNQTAVDNKAAYGNPWQLVWVFDNDPETNVVCEGYSKAFEYLCNQTDFAGDIKVYCVTGDMQTNAAPGPHMWNMVAMDDGANYLVDVTNCDTDTWGYPDQLFMAYSTVGTASVSYRISTTEGYVTYSYDTSTRSSYTADELLLAGSAYTGSTKNVAVNAVNFPDSAFRAYISEHVDTNADGKLSPAEISAVTSMSLGNLNISSLTGVEHFTGLTSLEALNNSLTEIDLTELTSLNFLYLSGNNITEIDLTGLPLLDSLWLDGNPITEIDVTKNTMLYNLKLDYTDITEIDVTNNTALRTLDIQGTGVKTLDVSKNTELVQLICQNCGMENVDVSKNINLTSLWVSANELTRLDVSKNTKLTELFCAKNHLTWLDLSNNPLLTDLRGDANIVLAGTAPASYSFAAHPGFDGSKASSWQGADYNKETNAITNITGNYVRYTYDCGNGLSLMFTLSFAEEKVQINAAAFPDAAFRTYVLDQLDPNADGFLTPAEMAQITDIDVSSMGIKTLKGIEYFCNLTNLRCSDNELTELNLSSNFLLNLFVSSNALKKLDIGVQNTLSYLDVTGNYLTQLDLTHFPNLSVLYCSNNQLTQLELTGRDLTYCNVGTQYASNVLVINRGKNGYTIDLAPLKLDMDRVEVYNSDCWEVSPGVVGFAYQPDDLVYVWDTGLQDQEMEVVCQLSHLLDIDDPLPETTEGTRVPVKVYLSCGHSHPQALLYNGSSVVSVYSCVDDEYYDITLPVTQPGIQEFTVAATSGIPCRVSFTLITHAENKLTLPGKLDLIEEEAFAGLNIREVIVPEGVTDIEKNAFANCGNLALVTLPDSLESISNTAFDGCENLVILCAEDSTAHVFAQANNIRFLLK